MKSVRSKLSALVIVWTMIAAAAAPVLAAAGPHDMCAARQHECGRQLARLTQCCCPDASHGTNDGSPVPARAEIARTIAIAPIAVDVEQPAATVTFDAAVQTSPPHMSALDRHALFGSFLI